MVATCPHCGSVLASPVMFSAAKQRLYDFIRTHPGCDMEEIMSALYGHLNVRPTTNTITIFLKQMRPKLNALGLDIRASRPGPGATYTLTKDPENGPIN